VATRKLAFRRGSVRAVCSSSLIATMPDLSHSACSWEAGPTGGAPNDANHVAVYELLLLLLLSFQEDDLEEFCVKFKTMVERCV